MNSGFVQFCPVNRKYKNRFFETFYKISFKNFGHECCEKSLPPSSNVVSEIRLPLCCCRQKIFLSVKFISESLNRHRRRPAAGAKRNREMLRICSKLAPFRLSLMPYPSTLYAIVSAIKLRAPTEHADILRIEDAFGYVTLTRHAIDLVSASKCIQNLLDVQGSTNRQAPGCVNAAGKLRQKW